VRKQITQAWNKIQKELYEKGELHYTDIAFLLNCSESKAANIARQIPKLVKNVKYERGYLKVVEHEKGN